MVEIKNHQLSFPKLLTLGFLIVILVGTGLLMLPLGHPGSAGSIYYGPVHVDERHLRYRPLLG